MLDLRGNPGLSKVAETFLQQNISSLMVYLRAIQSGLVHHRPPANSPHHRPSGP